MSTQAFAWPEVDSELAREVREALLKPGQRELPCRYLYDEVGSALFEAITVLPEYGLTRADARIIEARAGDIAAIAGGTRSVAELGSGSGTKTRAILQALGRPDYYPIDVSQAALDQCARQTAAVARVHPIPGTYLDGLREFARQRRRGEKVLVLFLGSTIGNFDRGQARAFLACVRESLRPGDALLLGTDLQKPVEQLLAAYDDPAGVTAAFNRNLLARLNRELGADFDLRSYSHEARYDSHAHRIEMHLRARTAQTVNIPAAGLTLELRACESIRTESSYKFTPAGVDAMARSAHFRTRARWVDAEWPFAESLLFAV